MVLDNQEFVHDREEEIIYYQNIGIKFQESIYDPNNSIAKVSQWESEWHVLHTLCLDHHTLQNK